MFDNMLSSRRGDEVPRDRITKRLFPGKQPGRGKIDCPKILNLDPATKIDRASRRLGNLYSIERSMMNSTSQKRSTNRLCLSMLVVVSSISSAAADEFVLKDGRQISGVVQKELTNEATKQKQLVVDVGAGTMVLINQSDIKRHSRSGKAEQAYADLIKAHFADTVEFHLKMAGYCHENGLSKQETAHLERVIELDPNERTARAGLKYMMDKDGSWVKRDELMTEGRGKVLVGGKYRFPELVALEEAQEKANQERITLTNEMRRWQIDVMTQTRRAADSLQKLKTVDGPFASSAVTDMLFPRANALARKDSMSDEMKLMYIEILQRLADAVSVQTLVRLSLQDGSPAVRDRSLDVLRKIAPKPATLAFIAALNSDEPNDINAAGRALAAMNESMAVLPLIEHVTTSHRRTTPGGSPTVGFNSNDSFTMGKVAPKVINQQSENRDVLAALVSITGQNYSYDKSAWLAWYSQQRLPSVSDLRRDN